MKKFLFLTLIFLFTLKIYCSDATTDFAKIESDWKKYLESTNNFSAEEEAAFRIWGFESPNLNGRYDNIKDFPKKIKINNYEHLQMPTRDGLTLDGWFIPVENAKGTFLIVNWHSGDMSQLLTYTRVLLKLNYQLIVYNIRFWNYADKPEQFVGSIKNDINDIEDILTYIKTRKDIDTSKLGIMGFSRGGYRAILAGAKFSDFKVVISDGGPTSENMYHWQPKEFREKVANILKEKTGIDVLSDEFNSELQIAKISPRPVLLLYGGADNLVVPENGKKYQQKAKQPKKLMIFKGAGHCNALNTKGAREIYIKTITEFLNKYLK
ncbi:MAG: hypothetical protein A2Y34_11850 [Spirochaetes bacterium GWC1_27_15]|nr:MAG: hypothetical protein A2Z98_13430 [Spirochaetes bacterium GWB1_27_13]OHD20921.1 MAG: hypothetical protein A2Y34_11850 [Spirochaetes bacterium GWC1_27_15]